MRRQEAPRTTRSVKEQGDSTRRAEKVPENNVKDVQIQNNVKDGQREAKVQNDVMVEKRCTNAGLTDVSSARGVVV